MYTSTQHMMQICVNCTNSVQTAGTRRRKINRKIKTKTELSLILIQSYVYTVSTHKTTMAD